MCERIKKGVGRCIIALARATQHTSGRGEKHEDGEVKLFGELMQVESCIQLGPEDAVNTQRGEGLKNAIVEHPGGMDDADKGVLGRNGREQALESVAIGDVAGGDCDLSPRGFQFALECVRAGSGMTLSGREKQMLYAVFGDDVPGDEGANGTGTPCNEHRAFGAESQGGGIGGRGYSSEPCDMQRAIAQGELELAGGECSWQSTE
jgi:hypothetical protein